MSGKNLTFKLIMEGDNKGLVASAKQSQEVTQKLFDSIKREVEQVKKASQDTSKSVGDIGSSETKQKVAQLVSELHGASQALDGLGKDANLSAENLKHIGDYGKASLDKLQADLEKARQNLNYLSATNATPTNIDEAQREVKDLEQGVKQVKIAFDAYSGAANASISAIDKVGDESLETAQQVKKLDTELGQTNAELKQTESASKVVKTELAGLNTSFNAVTAALATLGIGATAQEIANTSDEFKSLVARIDLATTKSGNFKAAFQGVKQIAVETRSDLTSTAELFTRIKSAVDQLGYSQERALGITQLVNKSLIVGGGLTASNEAAIYQFNQALQSGVLRGEEFNSVMEQAPRLARALADGLGVPIGKMREMAGEGKLTSDVIVKALESQSEALNKEFAKMPVTIGQSITNLKTAWTLYIGEADAATGASAEVAEALKYVAENLDQIIGMLELAARAFIAYKALNIANTFLDKAAGIRAAQVAIVSETAAVVSNTQAQLTNAAATRGAAAAKTQLATNAATATQSITATSMTLGGLIGRLGQFGIAVTALGLLVPTVFEPLGTYIGESVAKLQGYGKVFDELASQQATEAAQAKIAAGIKAEQATAAEKARDKIFQLNAESKSLVATFDGLIKKGEPVVDALTKISESMKFDSTKGINDSITALIVLEKQGKITAEELQTTLERALNGKDLLVFQANAQAAFAGTAQEAVKSAAILEAVMNAALTRTSFETQQLKGAFSSAFQSANNDVQIIIDNLEKYKLQGIDTGLALSANLNNAIDSAQTAAEIDYAKKALVDLGKQGLISGDQVALGLSKIEQKASQLPSILNPVQAAFAAMGVKTQEQLDLAAQSAQASFDVVSKSGQATADGIQQAYKNMLDTTIATGDKAKIAVAQAKAASLGLEVQLDATGQATVAKLGDMQQAAIATQRTIQQVGNSSSNTNISKPVSMSPDKETDDYWESFKKRRAEITAKANAASQARLSNSAVRNPITADSMPTTQAVIPDAPMIASSFGIKPVEGVETKQTVEIKIDLGTGQSATVSAAPEQADALKTMLQELEKIKRSS